MTSEELFRQVTELHKISYLFHITHRNNLESIAQSGLKPHNQAHADHDPVDISDPSVNQRRSRHDPVHGRSLHDYVPLYFRARNPMLYRRSNVQEDLAILYVHKSVMLIPGAIFTDGNAASKSTRFFDDLEDLDQLDWECLRAERWSDFDDGRRRRCAEVLVPRVLPFALVSAIVVQNMDSLTAARAATRLRAIRVRPDWFFRES